MIIKIRATGVQVTSHATAQLNREPSKIEIGVLVGMLDQLLGVTNST